MDTRARSRAAARAAGTGVPAAAARPHTVEPQPQPEPSAIPLPTSPPPHSAPPEIVTCSSQLIQELLQLDPATCAEVLHQFNAPSTADWESTPSRIPCPIPFQTPLHQLLPQ